MACECTVENRKADGVWGGRNGRVANDDFGYWIFGVRSRLKSNPRVLGKISGVSGDRKVTCDLELVVKRKR